MTKCTEKINATKKGITSSGGKKEYIKGFSGLSDFLPINPRLPNTPIKVYTHQITKYPQDKSLKFLL